MHVTNDYYVALEYITKATASNDMTDPKEMVILFVNKYKSLLQEYAKLKSQKEKIECQKKQESKLSKKKKTSKKKQI